MGLVRRVVDDEPIEPPNEMGRHLLRIAREEPGRWVAAYESENRSRVVMYEGCLVGRAKGRIAGITNTAGWDARVVAHEPDADHKAEWWELRVKFEGPVPPGQQTIPVSGSGSSRETTMERLRQGHQVET